MCINCILRDKQPVCHSCMVRGVTVGWDSLPECCKGCDAIDEQGQCRIFRDTSRNDKNGCGIRSPGAGVKDWSRLREDEQAQEKLRRYGIIEQSE